MLGFSTVEEVSTKLRAQDYLCDRRIATTVFLAAKMQKPILVEGPAGVGKTELAKVLAKALSAELIRLQCYEGLDEGKALYEWEYPKQLLYTQILRDKISEVTAGATTLTEAVDRLASQEDAFFSERFLLQRPLLRAIRAQGPTVLLIDEVDRADPEFEAFLLEVLSDFQVSVPELGTLRATPGKFPLVLLTSNNARELTDALKRRCLHLHIGYPDEARELEIVRAKVPGIELRLAGELVKVVQSLRKLDLKKNPSVSETLDWARALTIVNAASLSPELVSDTLNLILKYEGDIERATEKLPEILAATKS